MLVIALTMQSELMPISCVQKLWLKGETWVLLRRLEFSMLLMEVLSQQMLLIILVVLIAPTTKLISKILLQQLLADKLIDDAQRNQLLDSMTADIAELVLKNNYQQSKMLSQSNYTSRSFVDKHLQLIQLLEKEGTLNRKLEYLPDDGTVEERIKSQQGLTRPEIAILLAYSKTHLYGKIGGFEYYRRRADLRRTV